MTYSEGLRRRPARASRSGSVTRPCLRSRSLTRSATAWNAPSTCPRRPTGPVGDSGCGVLARTMNASMMPPPAAADSRKITMTSSIDTSVHLLARRRRGRREQGLRQLLAAGPKVLQAHGQGAHRGVVAERRPVLGHAHLPVREQLLVGDLAALDAGQLGDAHDPPGTAAEALS